MEKIKNSLIDLDNGVYNIDTDRTMIVLEKILKEEFNGEIKDAILEVKDTMEILLAWKSDNIKRLNEYYFGKNKCGNCKGSSLINWQSYDTAPKDNSEMNYYLVCNNRSGEFDVAQWEDEYHDEYHGNMGGGVLY